MSGRDISQIQREQQAKLQELQQKAQKELYEFQKDTVFPNYMIPADFVGNARRAMEFHSPTSMNISLDQFCALWEKEGTYNMIEMGTLLNIMESKTMQDMNMVFPDYAKYQANLVAMAVEFKKIIEPKAEAINRKWNANARLAVPDKRIVVPR